MPTVPMVCGTQNYGDESAEEDVDWFTPPPPPTTLPPPPSLPTIPTPNTSFELGMNFLILSNKFCTVLFWLALNGDPLLLFTFTSAYFAYFKQRWVRK